MADKTYTLMELGDATHLSARTIRYYITQDLLPGPVGQGRTAHYTEFHKQVLTDIALLKAEGKGLDQIRRIHEDRMSVLWKKVPKPDGNWDQFVLAGDVTVQFRSGMVAHRRHQVMHALGEFERAVKQEQTHEEDSP